MYCPFFSPPSPQGPEYPGQAALPPFQMRAQPVPASPEYPALPDEGAARSAFLLVHFFTYHRTLFP